MKFKLQPIFSVNISYFQLFDNWMKKEGAFDEGVKFTFVTCGDWDLNIMLVGDTVYFTYALNMESQTLVMVYIAGCQMNVSISSSQFHVT